MSQFVVARFRNLYDGSIASDRCFSHPAEDAVIRVLKLA